MVDVARARARGARPVAGDALAAEAEVVGGREVAEEVVAGVERRGAGLGDAARAGTSIVTSPSASLTVASAEAGGQRVGIGARAHACDRCCS